MVEKTKPITIILLILGIALLVTAGCFGYYLWWQGAMAETAAQTLLEEHTSETEHGLVTVSALSIPSLSLELPIIWEYSEQDLETALCRYQGPDPGDSGNLVIAGHDYLSGAHFGTLDQISVDDAVTVFGQNGTAYQYTVYAIEEVLPDDMQSLSDYQGDHALTLMTCTDNTNRRLLVKCTLD